MLTFRPAPSSDADRLGEICREIFDPRFGEGWTGAQIATTLAGTGTACEIAETDNILLGFSLIRSVADETELLLVGVRPRFRRRGLGRQLVERAANHAAARGSTTMHLEMRENNVAARKAYQTLGFVEVGRRREYYSGHDGTKFDAITMKTLLPLKSAKKGLEVL
ncbi:hypothetical protein B5C34_00790 [Pacificimonas flava]|uniref:N-acetyltransferase domain-containing protein n=2 Tax=Pacificimonas TaxID=1960290 RepID=A0A219B2T6_9SPHN|nr:MULTISPECIES: GNAT family N-acetyltransferase [Pacificimonas]MBZ6378251.1 GNAT family N-acetyltransferase [Pacificimonas aurantium]OWV32128.1 hypothetical protein B5C34_00790 [Pacificimonas flava]